MRKFILSLAAGFLLLPVSAIAQTSNTTPPLESSPAGQTMLQESQTRVTELADGSRVEIAPDNTVFVFGHDGTKTTPSDGTLTLKDGTILNVKDGKKV